MNVTEFIGRHLQRPDTEDIKKIVPCKMCGAMINEGIKQSVAIKPSFTDYPYLRYQSSWICGNCYACLGECKVVNEDGTTKMSSMRMYSFIATNEGLTILRRADLWRYLVEEKPLPFVFGLTFNGQKYISFKCSVNHSNDHWILTTDNGDILMDSCKINDVSGVIQNWYSVCDEKKRTTWFNKEDILSGEPRRHKIEAYGAERFFNETFILDKYRGGMFLRALVFAVEKKETND